MRSSLVGLALLAVAVTAADAETFNRNTVTVSGQPLIVWQSAAVEPDCTSAGMIQYNMIGSPAHGKVTVRRLKIFPSFPAGSPRAACSTRKVDGTEMTYVSDKGYHGPDAVEFETIGPKGDARRIRVDITVR